MSVEEDSDSVVKLLNQAQMSKSEMHCWLRNIEDFYHTVQIPNFCPLFHIRMQLANSSASNSLKEPTAVPILLLLVETSSQSYIGTTN